MVDMIDMVDNLLVFFWSFIRWREMLRSVGKVLETTLFLGV